MQVTASTRGTAIGLLADGSPEDCPVLGSAVCGFFVRNARSPSRTEVLKLLRQWAEEDLQRARDGVLDYLTFKK